MCGSRMREPFSEANPLNMNQFAPDPAYRPGVQMCRENAPEHGPAARQEELEWMTS
jgi:hypothetical protein